MELTKNQISVIIGILGFIIIGSAIYIWSFGDTSKIPETPEQQHLSSYYRCINTARLDEINNCNFIK